VKSQFKIGKSVADLDWDADSTRLVAAGDGNHKAKCFGWDSGNNLGELTMHSQPVISCSYRKTRPFRVVTAGEDLSVNMYEGPPFKYSNSYKGHTRYPNCVRFSPNGEHYLTVGADQKIVLFNGVNGQVVKEIESKTDGHKGAIYSFAWGPDSKQFLTVSADKSAKVWDIESGAVTKTFVIGKDINDQQVGAVWTNEFMITVSLSGAINYLDIDNPTTLKRVVHGHQSTVSSIALNPADGSFFTAGLSGEVSRWNFSTGDAQWVAGKGHGGRVIASLLVNADHTALISFGLDDKVRFSSFSAQPFGISDDGGDLGGMPVSAAASPRDPELSAAGLAQEKLVLIRRSEVIETKSLGFVPTAVTFSPDGNTLFVGGKNKQLVVFSVSSSSLQQQEIIKTHDKPISAVRVAPNGSMVVSTSSDASVYIHSMSGFELKNKSGWRFHQAGVLDVDWAPESNRFATGSIDCAIILWNDLKDFNGSERTKINLAHSQDVSIVRFWDQKTLISVSADRTIRVWEV
jgi:WD40 repeat protein